MKNASLLILAAVAAFTFQSCMSGNHSAREGVDSVRNNYSGVPSNQDTSKVTTTLGSSTALDNSASGGTTINRGRPSSSTTMATPAQEVSPADTAKKAAPVAKADSVKKL